jgi:hypothetical protein
MLACYFSYICLAWTDNLQLSIQRAAIYLVRRRLLIIATMV